MTPKPLKPAKNLRALAAALERDCGVSATQIAAVLAALGERWRTLYGDRVPQPGLEPTLILQGAPAQATGRGKGRR